MSPEPLRLIFQRLDLDPPHFFADHLEAPLATALDQFLRLGMVMEIPPSQVTWCPGCGDCHQTRVYYLADVSTGTKRAYLSCPGCGPTEVSHDQLRRWTVTIPGVLSAVCHGADVAGVAVE